MTTNSVSSRNFCGRVAPAHPTKRKMGLHMRERKEYGFVVWPEESDDIFDSGEGGMECWLCVPAINGKNFSVRDVCITGVALSFVSWDAIPSTDKISVNMSEIENLPIMDKRPAVKRTDWPLVDCAICIGATTCSMFYGNGDVWVPSLSDLTEEGRSLCAMMEKLYNAKMVFVMALDT